VLAIACTTVEGRPVAVTGCEDGSVRVWDLVAGQPLFCGLNAHAGAVRAVSCITVDGRPFAVAGGDDTAVRVWDLMTGSLSAVLLGHAGSVQAVTCALFDGRPVAITGGMDKTVRVWDLKTNNPVSVIDFPAEVRAVACMPGNLVVTYHVDVACLHYPRLQLPR
jgi:WD40 repeat protein